MGGLGGAGCCADPAAPLQLTFMDFLAYDVLDQQRMFVPDCPELQGNLSQFLQRFEVSGDPKSLSPSIPIRPHPCPHIVSLHPHPCPQIVSKMSRTPSIPTRSYPCPPSCIHSHSHPCTHSCPQPVSVPIPPISIPIPVPILSPSLSPILYPSRCPHPSLPPRSPLSPSLSPYCPHTVPNPISFPSPLPVPIPIPALTPPRPPPGPGEDLCLYALGALYEGPHFLVHGAVEQQERVRGVGRWTPPIPVPPPSPFLCRIKLRVCAAVCVWSHLGGGGDDMGSPLGWGGGQTLCPPLSIMGNGGGVMGYWGTSATEGGGEGGGRSPCPPQHKECSTLSEGRCAPPPPE